MDLGIAHLGVECIRRRTNGKGSHLTQPRHHHVWPKARYRWEIPKSHEMGQVRGGESMAAQRQPNFSSYLQTMRVLGFKDETNQDEFNAGSSCIGFSSTDPKKSVSTIWRKGSHSSLPTDLFVVHKFLQASVFYPSLFLTAALRLTFHKAYPNPTLWPGLLEHYVQRIAQHYNISAEQFFNAADCWSIAHSYSHHTSPEWDRKEENHACSCRSRVL